MAGIVIKDVSKQYGKSESPVLKHIELEIHENEFLILVGPSGCGKTTLLRMIAGLESITQGDIFIGERRVNDLQPRERNISLVFQNYALYPHLNVAGNLAFGLKIQKRSKEEIAHKTQEIGKILELTELMNRKPGELSGGQRQRVALGRALIRETEVMLMDEPLSNLDAKLRVQTRGEILALRRQMPRTVVYVTHDQVEAMTMGDRIAVMYNGKIQQLDKPEVVYNRPANMFVAGFMGTPPMNFLKCTLTAEGDYLWLNCLDGTVEVPQQSLTERVRAQQDQAVILGIRPEDCEILSEPDVEGDFQAVVSVVEVLGAEQLLTLTLGDQELTAKLECGKTWDVGERVAVKLHPDKLHIFHSETEENLTL